MTRIVNEQDARDFVRGCTFMGTGGGGDPEDGFKWLRSALDEDLVLTFTPHEKIDDEAWTVCPFLMGSIAPHTPETKQKMKELGLAEPTVQSVQAEAVRLLEEHARVEIKAIVPIELGGSNTPGALVAGAKLGITVVDGDYTGRAIPEIPQTTPYLNGLTLWPIASVDRYGNKALILESTGYAMAERIGKFIAAASFGLAGQAGFLFKGKEMKRVVIPGTLSRCLEIGRMIRAARESARDPVDKIVEALNGWLLFRGKVTGKDWEDREGYYWGTHTITGTGDFSGHEFKIWFKNENHISWFDDKPYVTSPDMLIVVDAETGEPYSNAQIEVGHQVAVVGLRAVEQFRSQKGINILGPRHFGFDIDYKPIEDLVKK